MGGEGGEGRADKLTVDRLERRGEGGCCCRRLEAVR